MLIFDKTISFVLLQILSMSSDTLIYLYVKKQITFISLIAFVIFNSKFQKLVSLSVFSNNREVEIPLQQA